VITVGTFSKIIATGLRVGWVHARPEIIEVVARMRFDMGNSAMLHHTLAEYIDGGRLDDHLEEMRLLYAEKMDILASALTEFAEPYLTFTRPKGGFFLWLKLQKGLTAEAVQRAAVQEGVIFPIGRAFFPEQKESDGEHIRLAYSWTSKDDLREGAERLARACARAAEGE
jgi:DNA-binding transcriptional MocR family regulator